MIPRFAFGWFWLTVMGWAVLLYLERQGYRYIGNGYFVTRVRRGIWR